MSPVDVLFLAGFASVLGIMLASSRVIRAIAWEALRHPFTKSVITFHKDRIEVRHEPPPANESSSLTSAHSR